MIEAVFEFIFELIAEIILTPIIDGIMYFVDKIAPERKIPKGALVAIKLILALIILGAIFAFFIGLIAYFGAEDYTDRIVGKRLLIFSLVTFAVFTVIRIFTPNKKDDKDLNDIQ